MVNFRLDVNSINDLCELSKCSGFPYPITKEIAETYCKGLEFVDGTVQTYGAYHKGNRLVSVLTASFFRVFPCDDGPRGKVVHISGAYTHPEFRRQGYASILLDAVEKDAKEYGADYICMDSIADYFYTKHGFSFAPSNESRLWKCLT